MTRNIKIAGIVLAALAIGGGAIFYFSHSKEETAPTPVVAVQMAKAERKTIRHIVTAEAILFARNQAAITPKIAAPVRKFYVNRGSRVHAGELLAMLENRDLAAAVTENKGAWNRPKRPTRPPLAPVCPRT